MGKLLKKVRTREDKGGEHFIYAKGISSPTHVPTIWGRGGGWQIQEMSIYHDVYCTDDKV